MLDSECAPALQVCTPEQLRIESVAGTGAFAVVYRGRLDVSDTLVAVKVMPMDAGMDEMMLVRNATELAALSKIRHHNVVQIIAQFPDCVRSLAGSSRAC
jgi:serine/threonine protein kinase